MKGRRSTLSLFVSASVVSLCQSLEQATLVAGHIGRAAAVFQFNEVIVVDDEPQREKGRVSQSAGLLAKLLQYQETPQYLRKHLIPLHDDFRFVGSLPPLDAPHHQRATEWSRFREGVVLREDGKSSIVNVGLEKNARVEKRIRVGARVTLNVGDRPQVTKGSTEDMYDATLCSVIAPVQDCGFYWGFVVRIARGMSSVFLECPFEDGYDLVIGTSEHGQHISPVDFSLPSFSHLLIGFGGPADFCHYYLNTCPHQGSRTIRTEEALWISLSYLNTAIEASRS